jgi:hypothetical protein
MAADEPSPGVEPTCSIRLRRACHSTASQIRIPARAANKEAASIAASTRLIPLLSLQKLIDGPKQRYFFADLIVGRWQPAKAGIEQPLKNAFALFFHIVWIIVAHGSLLV